MKRYRKTLLLNFQEFMHGIEVYEVLLMYMLFKQQL